MKCPNCHQELKEIQYKGVKIHECENCAGKWFDKDELRLAKERTDDDVRWLNFDLFEEKGNKYNTHLSSKKCPVDNIEMHTLEYHHSEVLIDKCKTCKGIWLDRNEFQKIIKYLEKMIVTESAKGYEKEAIKKLIEIGTNHEDKISEIKDLLVITKLLEERFIAEHPSLEGVIRAIVISTPPGL